MWPAGRTLPKTHSTDPGLRTFMPKSFMYDLNNPLKCVFNLINYEGSLLTPDVVRKKIVYSILNNL